MLTCAHEPSPAYRSLRWLYQPIKVARRAIGCHWATRAAGATVRRYLESPGFKGLQIGSGPHRIDGWLNSDLLHNPKRDLYLDITRPLPFPDHCLDAIYASEVIEHVTEGAARAFFTEAARVLKAAGTLRLTTPDLTEICRLYLGQHPEATIEQFGEVWRRDGFTPERWVNGQFRHHGHEFLWSLNCLSGALFAAGFKSVVRCAARQTESDFAQLGRLERHYGENLPTWIFARTLIVEAYPTNRRPPRVEIDRSDSGPVRREIPSQVTMPF